MSGDTPRRRRHSPAVYRRRRLVVLLVFLIVVAGAVWLFIAQPWQAWASDDTPHPTAAAGSATPSPTPSASASASAAPEASAEPEGTETPTATPCVARDLTVEAVTDKGEYAAGENPLLSIRLTNDGADCTLNVGTAAQTFTITSGSDVWWRSTDCQSEPSDMLVLLEAGQTVESANPVEWDRTRSSVDTCSDAGRPGAPGGGASYYLDVEIGGVSSSEPAYFLLF
ncbi:hypothetical protein [Microbacterium xanthum]|uniref:hypothetical protein n=1 Tax=Microbacterium xanthum TaxID=3079794 RepID=UPI002AD221E3|nr:MULTISPECIES: hypothetical protein [unclassified Microbacterium]MDZ8171511.1 hypothetical protein [Microbacterium sp. KSW-48]MDZ8200450.1 hypothetical protein [Microbacterium sp. SSW1-59]